MAGKPRLIIRLLPDGTIRAETAGMSGDKCVSYAAILEDLCDAQAIDSSYTADYQLQSDELVARDEVKGRDNR